MALDAQTEARIAAELLERGVESGVFPGAAVAIGSPQIREVVAVGSRRLVPTRLALSPDTWFDVASLTKPIVTVTLAMTFVERGLLDLDAPVATWLEPFADDPRKRGVRVRDLLGHSSGLPAWRPLFEQVTPGERAQLLALAAREPLERDVGSASVYSDLGFLLLGDILERIARARIDDLFGEIRTTLGMSAAYGPIPPDHPVAATELDERGRPFEGIVHDENARAMLGIAPHAGLFATASDVANFCGWLLDVYHGRKTGLLSAETLRTFLEAKPAPGSTWCLGFDRPSPRGYSSAGAHLSRRAIGHLGFTGCSFWIDLEANFFIVLLSNRVHPSRTNDAIRAFRPLLHDALVPELTRR